MLTLTRATTDADLEDYRTVFQVVLPAALSYVEPIIEKALRKGGQKLLAPPE